MKRRTYVGIQLPDEAGEVVVLEIFGCHIQYTETAEVKKKMEGKLDDESKKNSDDEGYI
ncbi:hypothetical protein L195_g051744 [Trifolium pratense]|uniref:Uncharacterized protein n=1 Tax=Trifolium pratense TaxID=57577 RepID=A0A2K3K1F0_TRIPR|nr:hypothetical protein L195_g051744 [Trifolium pratense]